MSRVTSTALVQLKCGLDRETAAQKRSYISVAIRASLLLFAAVLATADAQAGLAGTAQRLLLQVPPRTGLYYNGKGTGSARNITRRNYFQSRSKADQLRILGASTNATQIIRAACNTSNILDSACIDVLLLALTPPSYSSNNTLDTPLRRAFISPAQDQGMCASCVGFAVTAAAEAAINVYKQQSWRSLGLSEQDFSFCKVLPRVNCTASSDQDCARAAGCPNQLPAGGSLSWAYAGSALGTMAQVKERIMLSGGVVASMAMTADAFKKLEAYSTGKHGVFSPKDDVEGAPPIMHAVFCYGWWDNATNAEDGWWLCKNSWGTSWGLNGSIKVAYAVAKGRGYRAVCTLTGNAATWQVKGGCPAAVRGPIKVQAEPTLCVSTQSLVESGQQVVLQTCGGTPNKNQQFVYKEGRLTIQAAGAEWCLGVSDGSTDRGAEIKAGLCDGTANQRWLRDAEGALRPLHALGSCLDVPYSNFSPGVALQLWDCNRSAAQLFWADLVPYVEGRAGIMSVQANTSLCMAAPVELQPCSSSSSSRFIYQTDGSLRLEETNWCLDAFEASTEWPAAVGIVECNGKHTQRWFKDVSGALQPAYALERQLCLDVPNKDFTPEQSCSCENATKARRRCLWLTSFQNNQVFALYQLVPPGGPIPRGCVTDQAAFLQGHPSEEFFGDETAANYATAGAFARMKGTKYFAVARVGDTGYGYTFSAEPTTAPLLNITVNGSLGCYTPCADDASKPCGSGDGFGGATLRRVWFVYELPS
ncbi:hypothetical protein OEZ86_014646 [Tetradesmus obliquus]|nr:hypothetical protein OEZ86_014646 [Tetradesmus obliquus]